MDDEPLIAESNIHSHVSYLSHQEVARRYNPSHFVVRT